MQYAEEITDLSFRDERMAKRQFRLDLVHVSPTGPLTLHVSPFDQLRDDPVSTALGDPDGGGDLAQADTGVA